MKKAKYIAALVVSAGIPLAVGFAGSLFMTPAAREWYDGLARPWFTPPDWVFGPVWTVLYIMMGIAAFLVWREGKAAARAALLAFAFQLLVNALWTPAFFGMRSTVAGLAVISLLAVAVGVSTWMFYRVKRQAALLMLPYLAWVSFALVLNLAIVLVNP